MDEIGTTDRLQVELEYMMRYRAAFEHRYPPPVRQVVHTNNWLVYGVLGALVSASVIVSAYHTIPIFVGSDLTVITFIVGLAVFVMVELGIVSLTYINIKKSYELNPDKHTSVLKWLQVGLALVFIVGLGVNVYSEVMKTGFAHPLVDLIIRILVGLSAPVMAFVSGEVIAMIGVDAQHQQRAFNREHAANMVAYQDKFLAWWDARKNKILQSVMVTKEPAVNSQPHSLNSANEPKDDSARSVNSVNSVNSVYSKNMNSREVIEQFFVQHPERLKDKLDVLLADIERDSGQKVGRTSVHNVRSQMIERQ